MRDYFRPELLSLGEPSRPPIYYAGSCESGQVASSLCSTGGHAGGSCSYTGATPYAV